MYRRPTRSDELASPFRCLPFADRRSKAAEFAAPHETMTSGASTQWTLRRYSTSTPSTRFPSRLVRSRRASALVQSVTLGCASAWVTAQDSASLFAPILHGKEFQVLH